MQQFNIEPMGNTWHLYLDKATKLYSKISSASVRVDSLLWVREDGEWIFIADAFSDAVKQNMVAQQQSVEKGYAMYLQKLNEIKIMLDTQYKTPFVTNGI